MLPSLLQRLAWHSSNVRSVAQFTPAIGCASARYLRCCSTVCRSCLQLRPPPAPSSPPRFPATPKQPSEGQRGPAVCRIAASATVAYTLRGTNDTAGITCVTSLVARFTSGERVAPQARLRLRPLPRHEPADRLLLHTLVLQHHAVASREPVSGEPEFHALDSAILRRHVAPCDPLVHTILRRIRAAAALDAVDAPHQEHSPRYLSWCSLWSPRLLREWRSRLQRAHDRVQHRYGFIYIYRIYATKTLTVGYREAICRRRQLRLLPPIRPAPCAFFHPHRAPRRSSHDADMLRSLCCCPLSLARPFAALPPRPAHIHVSDSSGLTARFPR